VTKRLQNEEVRLQGLSICPGIGMGYVFLMDPDIAIPQEDIDVAEVTAEQARYSRVVQMAQRHLPEHIATVHGELSVEAQAILQVHEAILSDESFHTRVRKRIAAERKRAEFCLDAEAALLVAAFQSMRDPYFRARSEDIRDMAYNLLEILANQQRGIHRPMVSGDAVISLHLHSSSVVMARRGGAVGFASESRALASHAAILLKGFGMPSVGAVDGLLDVAREGDRMIIDGSSGLVIVRPRPRTNVEYGHKKRGEKTVLVSSEVTPCRTADGTEITLRANIENPEQIPLLFAHGLDGIGLFRTEFLIPPDGRLPSEEEQYEIYRNVVHQAGGRLVVFRTFDIGSDKQWGMARGCAGLNPALGIRGIRRHLMDNEAELRSQLRALLRAADDQELGILVPMVTTTEDVQQAGKILNEVRDELNKQGHRLPHRIARGAMIEVPAAAIAVADILQEVDFVSLGTNDLLQYFMAADRDNERVVHYNEPIHPAFLWLLSYVMQQAAKIGRAADVTVCGETAADPRMLPHFLRLHYRSFSIAPVAAPMVRDVIAHAENALGNATKRQKEVAAAGKTPNSRRRV
jgi:phosphoenolpyruvate-protein phosphotransferase (PTS system enzyme I)